LAALEPHVRVRPRLGPRRLARRGLQPGRRGLQPRSAHRARRRRGREPGRVAVGGAGHGHARRAQAAREPARGRADRGAGRGRRRHGAAAGDQRAAGHRAGTVPRRHRRMAHRPAGGVGRGAAPRQAPPAFGGATRPPDPPWPVYTRYWLHGKGPAPAGNLPVAVHLSPVCVGLPDLGETAALTLTVGCGAEPASGTVELVAPAGVTVAASRDLRYDLAPGGYAAWGLSVRVPPGTAPGRYFVAARIRDDLGQLIEDTAMV